MAPSSSSTLSTCSPLSTSTLSTSTLSTLSTLLSMFLVVLWAALAVGAVLTLVFPERSLATSSMFGSSGSSVSGARTASVR